MASYPVIYDVQQQESYDKVQIAIRIVVFIILNIIGGILGLIYLAVPVYSAIQISQNGSDRYLAESEQNITKWLRWLAGAASWLYLLTDSFPASDKPSPVRFDVTPEGAPTAGGVLLRIITLIPHLIALAVLGFISMILLVIAAIMVLIQGKYPEGIFNFIRGDLRWGARVFVYLAGLAQAYPPFALDMGPEGGEPVASGVAATTPPSGGSTGAAP